MVRQNVETTLSSKGQIVLPAEARRRLRLAKGERLRVEIRDGGLFLQPMREVQRYRLSRHAVSGLPVMVALESPARKVTAAEIAQLNAELL
jgi:AbrB family looped-hinge helix DNA binding protein